MKSTALKLRITYKLMNWRFLAMCKLMNGDLLLHVKIVRCMYKIQNKYSLREIGRWYDYQYE